MMRSPSPTRPFSFRRFSLLYGAAVILAAAALHESAAPARAEECQALDQYGVLRDCTAMEEYGSCLWDAVDSFEQCTDDAGFWATVGCYAGWIVDYYSCALALPIDVLF